MPYLHKFSDTVCNTCGAVGASSLMRAAPQMKARRGHRGNQQWEEDRECFIGLFTCSNCRAPFTMGFSVDRESFYDQGRRQISLPAGRTDFLNRLATVEVKQEGSSRPVQRTQLQGSGYGVDLRSFFRIDWVYPKVMLTTPEDLPDDLKHHFEEDLSNIIASVRHAVVECRTILELAAVDKLPELKKKGPRDQIDGLVRAGFLTKSMGDWVHTIRTLANSAIHEGDRPTEEERDEVVEFTRIVLELLYSYPARIERLKKKRDAN